MWQGFGTDKFFKCSVDCKVSNELFVKWLNHTTYYKQIPLSVT